MAGEPSGTQAETTNTNASATVAESRPAAVNEDAALDQILGGDSATESAPASTAPKGDDGSSESGPADEPESSEATKTEKSAASKAATEREARKRRIAEVQARVSLDRAAGLLGWDKEDLEGLPSETIIKLGTKAKAALDAKQREYDQRATRPGEASAASTEGGKSPADPGANRGVPQADPEASARVAPAEGLDAVLEELDEDSARLIRGELTKAKTSAAAQAEQARRAFVEARVQLFETWGDSIRHELQAEYPALESDDAVKAVLGTMVDTFGQLDVASATREEFAKRFRYAAYAELGESTRRDASRQRAESAKRALSQQPFIGGDKRGTDRTTMTREQMEDAVFDAINGAADLGTARTRAAEALGTLRG